MNPHHAIQSTVGVTLLCLVVLTGCTATATNQPKVSKAETAPRNYRFVGRVQLLPSGQARYAWSGAGVVARFYGTGATVRLKDDKNEHQVVLDGVPVKKLVTQATMERYPLVTGLPPGEHRLELYRRTEALFGPTTFLGLEIEGGALVASEAVPQRRIELVGDSISCGYGDLGKTSDCSFSADTENHYDSYGAVLARSFHAELSTVAWSGRGVVKNYAGEPGEKLGTLYERILPEGTASRWQPNEESQAVIVNAGTNDFSTEPDPDEKQFVIAYTELLAKVRRNSPTAFILCTIGPMLGGEDLEKAERAIAQAVQLRKGAGDQRVLAFRMKTTNQEPGCDWHPGIATHQRMAAELATPIAAALGW